MLSAEENDLIELPSFSHHLHFSRCQRPSMLESYDIIAISDGLVLYGRIVHTENYVNHMTDYHIYNPVTQQ